VIEPMREFNRFEGLLASRDVFFQYARRLTSGQVPSAGNFHLALKSSQNTASSEGKAPRQLPSLEISDAILEDFKAFLRDRNIDFTDEDIQNNVDFIERRIKQEVYTSSFGLQEGFRVAIQGDAQVLKGLELMPEAKSLMASGRTIPAVQNPSR
jgi:hypothetical protein